MRLYTFMKLWPAIKLVKPQKLQMSRTKGASKETIDMYFHKFCEVLQQNNLMEAPEIFYNTGISIEHSPPKTVCFSTTNLQGVTSSKQPNMTIIAGANAIKNSIPSFYVIPRKRWSELLDGAPAGSGVEMPGTG